jgi:hypothetical protein
MKPWATHGDGRCTRRHGDSLSQDELLFKTVLLFTKKMGVYYLFILVLQAD